MAFWLCSLTLRYIFSGALKIFFAYTKSSRFAWLTRWQSTMTYEKSLYCSLAWYLMTKKNSNGENTESKQPFCAQTLHFVYDAFSCIWWPLQNLSQCLRLNTLNSLSCLIFCGNGPLIKVLIYYALLQISRHV